MDIQMETETAGIDATRVIHETMPECKIIILTIHSDDEMLFRAYSGGAMDFIVKTDSITKIVSSIEKVSQNQMQLRSDVAAKIVTEFRRIRNDRDNLLSTLNILTKMTNSEFEVLCCIYRGDSYREVAKTRFVSEATIKSQVNSILKKDMPAVMSTGLFLAALFCIIMLIVDLLYAFIDPRIKAKYARRAKS